MRGPVRPAGISIRRFPGTFLTNRTSIDPASFAFADPLIIRLPNCPPAVFRSVVLPFYAVGRFPKWAVPGIDCDAKPPYRISEYSMNIDDILAVLTEGADQKEEDGKALDASGIIPDNGEKWAVDVGTRDEQDDEAELSPAVVDRCLKFLLIPSSYDVSHAVRYHSSETRCE
ncbi:hypothetical protein HK405_000322 [Cladochytrium tenue]|nr:hypothetical protein HK405_000322 [Cladochytrium tenue]